MAPVRELQPRIVKRVSPIAGIARISIKPARRKRKSPRAVNMVMKSANHASTIQALLPEDHSLLSFAMPGFSLTIELCSPNKSKVAHGDPFLDACFNLIEATSGADYKASSMGWHPSEKKKEMKDKAMMYLLVRRAHTNLASDSQAELDDPRHILGFLSFMFTNDDPPHAQREVVYIYEIHLAEELRGAGLGSHLVKIVEEAARLEGISKTMLTVFSCNKKARCLYEKLGYSKDACSPPDREVRGRVIEADYVIMGKELA